MDIRFLRPELAELDAGLQEAFGMMGEEVDSHTFLYELQYAALTGDIFEDDAPYLEALLPYLATHTPAPATLLDVGGGTGRMAIPLAKAGYNVTMLDPAASGLRIAQEKAEVAGVADRLEYLCGQIADAARLGEEAFDAVLAIQCITLADDLRPALVSLCGVSRTVLCFDVHSRYGFLASRMAHTGHAYTAGFTPTSILHVLSEHTTPGPRTFQQEHYPLYTSTEIRQLATEAGLQVDEVRPVSYQEVFQWQGGADRAVVAQLEKRLREDRVLRELSASHLVLARKPVAREAVGRDLGA